jgi:glycosyltransferase involved in cell wall biosynthesis
MNNIPIIFFKKLNSVGGPTSFQRKFTHWLNRKKINFDYLNKKNFFKKKVIFINSGTFNLLSLFFLKSFKNKIIQRLDGFYDYSNVGRKTKNLRCLLINFSMQFIRKHIADYIIYQSLTSKRLWDKTFGKVTTNYSIIHNPSFDNNYTLKRKVNSSDNFNIIIVEGNIEDNEFNKIMLNLIHNVAEKNTKISKIIIFGNINNRLKKKLSNKKKFTFKNIVSHKILINFYKNKNKNNIFFGIEYNPCCSNSIIEASSFGIPTITLNTGSYKELIKNSGIQINFKKIDDKYLFKKFSHSLFKIINNYENYSERSIKNSKQFKPDIIFNNYINSIRKLL